MRVFVEGTSKVRRIIKSCMEQKGYTHALEGKNKASHPNYLKLACDADSLSYTYPSQTMCYLAPIETIDGIKQHFKTVLRKFIEPLTYIYYHAY